MVRERPRRQTCRSHIEEIVGYSVSLLNIGRSLQLWLSLKDVCCVVFIKVEMDICPSLSLLCALRTWFLSNKSSETCAYAGHISLRAWHNSFREISVLSNAGLLMSLVAQLFLGAKLCSVGLLLLVTTGSTNEDTVKPLNLPHIFTVSRPLSSMYYYYYMKVIFTSTPVHLQNSPTHSLNWSKAPRGAGCLKTKSSIIGNMTDMLALYLILSLWSVAILQF